MGTIGRGYMLITSRGKKVNSYYRERLHVNHF